MFNLFANFSSFALEGEAAAVQGVQGSSTSMIVMLVLMVAVFYFIVYRPQKKQEKKNAEMRNNLMIGDEITTTGGIIGKVVKIKDDIIVIETGTDKTKIKIHKWALSSVDKKGSETVKPASFKVSSSKTESESKTEKNENEVSEDKSDTE